MRCISIIQAASKGNPTALSLYYKDLLQPLLGSVHSPLAAPYITKLYIHLRETVFDKQMDNLGELIAYVTLRLLKPQCDLDTVWEEEDLTKAMIRTISLIHTRTVKKKDSENDEIIECRFTAPAFCYSFQLMKSFLLSSYAKRDESLVHDCLQIIAEHARLRGTQNHQALDLYHPKYLPRKQMFELLTELISKNLSN